MKSWRQSIVEGLQGLSPKRRQFLLVAGSILGLVFLVSQMAHKSGVAEHAGQAVPSSRETTAPTSFPIDASNKEPFNETSRVVPAPPMAYGTRSVDIAGLAGGPRITYSAELAVATKEFAHARTSMEEVLERHRGYTAKLRMVGQPSGSVLSATLRVPATEYRGALTELKSLGDVERDEESADEIAQQHGDLEARLQNAQNNERRLQQLLKDSSDKGAVLAPVEQQLSVLRGEIVRLEAERRAYDDRAVFSNIYFSMREARVAPPESFGGEIRGAAVAGVSDAIRNLFAILVFCVSYGPSLLLWAAFLYFPARMLWRRFRPATSLPTPTTA